LGRLRVDLERALGAGRGAGGVALLGEIPAAVEMGGELILHGDETSGKLVCRTPRFPSSRAPLRRLFFRPVAPARPPGVRSRPSGVSVLWPRRMVPRKLKALYYALLQAPMAVSSRTYRVFRAPRTGTVKVHLGPGQRNYLPGWINVDANVVSARPDVWADLRDVLPFRDGTVDVFYSHHMIEHLPDAMIPFHLREMHRCLKHG